jgi:DNA topoisomerase VI subunit B
MITERYDYTPIKRKQVDGKRLYTTPTGVAVPSVTTILDKTKSEEKKQILRNWKKRVGEAKAQEIVTEASGRGTRMHKWLEDYCIEDKIKAPGSNPFSQQSHKMAEIVIEKGMSHVSEIWGTEVPLYFPSIYAGTTDCVGLYDGKPSIIDFKQTNKPKKTEWVGDYFLQLTAYATAHNEIHGTDIRQGAILMCSKDYEYQYWVLEGDEWDKTVKEWWKRVEDFYTNHF